MKLSHLHLFIVSICLLMFVSGCRSNYGRVYHERMTSEFYRGNTQKAMDLAEVASDNELGSYDRNALFWHLEYASSAFYNKDYGKSLAALNRAEKLVYLLNAQGQNSYQGVGAVNYTGVRTDKLMINFLKFFNYMEQDNFEDALVEIRRLRATQYDYLLNKMDPEIKNYNSGNINKKVNTKRINDMLLAKSNLTIAYEKLDFPKEFGAKLRPSLALMTNPMGFYLSALGYYWDNDYEEAAIDLSYLMQIDENNELIKKDFVTIQKVNMEKIPEELKLVDAVDYPLNDNIIFVVFSYGKPTGWAHKKSSFRLPEYVPSHWNLSYPNMPSTDSFQLIVDSDKRKFKCEKLLNIQDVLIDEYSQIMMPKFVTKGVEEIAAMTVANVAAKASLVAAIAIADPYVRAAAIASATIAIEATKSIHLNNHEWRQWSTLANNYDICHFPIPQNRQFEFKIYDNAGKAIYQEKVRVDQETHHAVLCVRVISDNNIFSQFYQSME